MKHHPIYDVRNGAWHAAYATPGQTEGWTSVVECPTKDAAIETCRQLNAADDHQQRQLKADQQLRGMRV